MAPIESGDYLPPLDRCFSGEHQLLSWEATYTALSSFGKLSTDPSLQKHLTNSHALHILSNSLAPFEPPTPKTKSTFETKTSAINVSPSPQHRYDIGQIQEDTLWLSKKTNIDEVAALRVAVQEWQSRPASKLMSVPVEAIGGSKSSLNGNSLQLSLRATQSFSRPGGPDNGNAELSSSDEVTTRRNRLLHIHLSDRRYILKTSEHVIFAALCHIGSGDGKGKSAESLTWLETLGNAILSMWNIQEQSQNTRKNFFVTAVHALQIRIEALEKGSGWFQEEDFQEELELAWARNQLLEMIYILQIMLTLLQSMEDLTRSDAFLAWFRLVGNYGFFQAFDPPYPAYQQNFLLPLQSLVSLVSLAMLQVPSALDLLSQLSSTGSPVEDTSEEAPYLLNLTAINEANNILLEAASVCLLNASPTVLAWGILMQTIREIALASKESRELRQSQKAVDRYATVDSSDTDSPDKISQRQGGFLSRRSSTGSDASQQTTFLEEIIDRIMDTALDEDPISYLAKSAVDGSHVLEFVAALVVNFCTPCGGDHGGKVGLMMRKVLLDLVRATLDWIPYQPELLLAALAVLTGDERYWDLWERPSEIQIPEPAELFLNDDLFLQKMLTSAQSRFPHESLPFFKLCRALATIVPSNSDQVSPIWQKLQLIDSFTCALPADFKGYELIREDEDSNYIQLTEDFSFVSHRDGASSVQSQKSMRMSRAITSSTRSSCLQIIPKGTVGRVVSESRPFVVLWRWDYRGLEYLGRVLKLASLNDNMAMHAATTLHSRDVVAEIIDLISTMVMSAMRPGTSNVAADSNTEVAKNIIEGVSDGLDRNGDAISVIFSIFEEELYRRRKVSETEGPGEILVRCTQFTYAVLSVMPDRIWPSIGRIGLLGIDGGESQLSNVVSTTEMITGQFDFLLGCVRIYESLVQDAISHAVARKVPTKAVTRFGSSETIGTGVSQIALKKILLAFTRSMLDILQSTMNWKFERQEERLEINSRVCTVFEKILSHCYAVDDSTPFPEKLTEPITPSADCLTSTFLSSNTDIVINPLLHIFREGTTIPDATLANFALEYWTSQTSAAVKLSTVLVRISCLAQNPYAGLQERLVHSSPLLAKLYAINDQFKLPVVELLRVLVEAIGVGDAQPPSLLAHLGQETASHFLEVLSVVDRPFTDVPLSVGIWRFLTAIVSKRQQWFAIFVLTGTSPRETLKDRKSAEKSQTPTPILQVALEGLSDVEKLHPQKVLGMLEFVARAVDNWPWIISTVEQHPTFLTALQNFLSGIGSASSDFGQAFSDYVKIQICSYIVEILAITTHHTQQSNNLSFARNLVPKINYLTERAVAMPGYNSSLHSKLRQNFESRFATCFLVNFKRTTLQRPMLGNSFYYDMTIAEEMLSFDPAWIGRKGSGFADEFKRANINLSLVESQVNLLYSWKCLAIQLSRSMSTESSFQNIMIKIIVDCLRSNQAEHNSTSLAVFEKLAQTRAELAFALLQRLIDIRCQHKEMQHVLTTAWDTIRKYSIDVEAALLGEGADYYRLLLRILLLALQVYQIQAPREEAQRNNSTPTRSSIPPFTIQTVLEIVNTVVARGFRALTTLLHDEATLVRPSDFALVTAILRTAFLIPDFTSNTTSLLTSFSDASTARCASTLLSWSDQLATDNDPVYGELSILFLLELSNVPALAESLAVEGVLSHITATNLMIYLRQEKALGPFDVPVRMYSIWSRGLLPLFLNLLHSVGPPIAAEIAGVLNSFPQQLARASNAFDTDGKNPALTSGITSEAQTLAVITAILDTFREAGASAGIVAADVAQVKWDRAQVKDDIETWLGKRPLLRDVIVPTTESEELLSKILAQRKGDAENRLEERIVDSMREVLSLFEGSEL